MILKMYGTLICKKYQRVLINWENGTSYWISFKLIPKEMIGYSEGQNFFSKVKLDKKGKYERILTCEKKELPTQDIIEETLNRIRENQVERKQSTWT